jgi:hypothetical protein
LTDIISSDDGSPWSATEGTDRPASGGGWRRLRGASQTTAMTAAVSLVLVGGVTTVAVRNFAPGADPAAVVPASAFAFAELDLSLPDGQDAAVAHLVDRFPGALKGSGSIRDRLLRAFFKSTSDPHVDYSSVEPWLGDHVAVAGWTDDSGAPQVEFVVQSSDDAAARKTVHDAAPDVGIAFSHGFAVLAPSQQNADAAVRAAAKSALAGSKTYAGDAAALDGSPLATAWVDGPATVKAIAHAVADKAGGLQFLSDSGLTDSATGRIVAGLRVSDDGGSSAVQLDVVSRGSAPSKRSTSTDRFRHLPATTFAAAAIADPAGVVRDATEAIKGPLGLFTGGGGESGSCVATPGSAQPQCTESPAPGPTDPLQMVTDATGLKLPGDLASLLGSDAVVAYGGIAGDGTPKIGVRSKPADVTAAADVVTKLRNKLVDTDIALAERTAGGDFVVATTDGYADDLAKAGTLDTVDTFSDAMRGMPASVGFAAYVDLGTLLPLATHGAAPQLDRLRALGVWSGVVNGLPTTQVRVLIH